MKKLNQAISDINNDLAAFNLDDRFSRRFIASKLKGKIELLLKQDTVDRTIFTINELWKSINCIELEDVQYEICSQFYEYCKCLKKSKKRIPETYTGKYGNFIKILTVDNSIEFKQTKPFLYKDIANREFKSKRIKYYWIEDGYLYIPDECYLEEVKGYGMFKDSQEADVFNGTIPNCYLPLDSELLVPDYILDVAKSAIVQELAQINKRLVRDENPDLNTNQK